MTEQIVPVPTTAVIVVAAGSGTRLGARAPKAFVALDGRTILAHALDGVYAVTPAVQVIIVAPEDHLGEAEADVAARGRAERERTRIVAGGVTRQASVAAGLAAVWGDVDTVLVHDAARALTPPVVFDRVIAGIAETGWGIVPVLPVVDTLKRVSGETVLGVVDRAELAAAQTPQGFRRDVLVTAYAAADAEYTDDTALVQAAGHQIGTVPGDALGFKITTPADLDRARTLVRDATGTPPSAHAGSSDTASPQSAAASAPATAAGSEPAPFVGSGSEPSASAPSASAPSASAPSVGSGSEPSASAPVLPRVGIGTDVHAFADDGVLWLAGLEWPGERALSGHSDGDAVSHAIVDALLSAAGLGDIGTHFGTSRPEFAGAHAEVFLAETRRGRE